MKALWSKDVTSATALAYPATEPSLMPGQTYKVVVTSDGLSSQQDHSPGLGFTTLTAAQARALDDARSKRRELGLPEPQTRFLISNLYAARELYSEAIEQLENLYLTMKEAPVAKMLGDLYAVIGLNREAEKKYLEALRLTPAGDLDGLGAIQINLSQVYENLGNFEQALIRLTEAIKAYRQLKDTARVKALLNEQRRLKKNGRRL
jgi:tetratricopeptide (TPR) repeat protein